MKFFSPSNLTAILMSTLSMTKRTPTRLKCSDKSYFGVTSANMATSLTDGVALGTGKSKEKKETNDVILPWVGYGTYKLNKSSARECALNALRVGYRCIDTAFIYGGETIESQVGLAIQDAISENIISNREEVMLVSKHWRKYHGYEPTLECLRLSLKRLEMDYIDLWLIHWPGPAWNTMSRRNDVLAEKGPWHYASHAEEDMPRLRSETWRAMEDAMMQGKLRAIGVSNFSIDHLKKLKQTARIWPPAVNQIECHPLYPQTELVNYCQKEGIVVQAYSSLGGQDMGKKFYQQIFPKQTNKKQPKAVATTKLWNAPPVLELAQEMEKTPAQILLRYGLERGLALIPKSSTLERMKENADIFSFSFSETQIQTLESKLGESLAAAFAESSTDDENGDVKSMGRLTWTRDPLRLLDFE